MAPTSTGDTDWHQPLTGLHLTAAPMGPKSDWQRLARCAQDPRLYDLAFGMGDPPALDYIQQCVCDTPDIRIWEASLDGRFVGYLVYSIWTNLPRVAAYFVDSPGDGQAPWDEALWSDGISMLSELFFPLEPERNMLYAHMALPVSEDTDTWLVGLGFAPADQAMYIRKLERAIYGLPRGVFDMFHEELDEDVGDY